MKSKYFVSSLTLILLIFIVLFWYFKTLMIYNNNIDSFVILTFVFIFIISIINIFRDNRPFSLNKTYWYFNLIFFGMAPLAQYLANYNVWGYYISNSYYIKTNLLILVGNIVHTIIYKSNRKVSFENDANTVTKKHESLLMFIAILCLTLLIFNVGFENLFLRTTNSTDFTESTMFNTIITCFLKATPVYCFTIMYQSSSKINIKKLITLLIIFIVNFPASNTRFWMGAIFIGIILLMFVKPKSGSRTQDIILIFTFTILFPITYFFHFYSIEDVLQNNLISINIADSYLSVDYDAYSIFSRIIRYVDENGIVFGAQLIGSILFMIPRAIWSAKPQATGAFIATATNQSFTNISSPFVSEGYINFGLMGLILFEIILAFISSKFDNNYWSKNKNKYLQIVYPYFIGLLLFYERGALHHAVVYTFCFLIPLILIFLKNLLLNQRRSKINEEM